MPAAAASGILVLAALGIEGIEAGLPPPVLTGGTDEGTLPAEAALGNEGGRLEGLPVETDEGIPTLLPPDGGKLLKLGNLPIVLLVAVEFIWLPPWPGKLEGLPVETDDGIPLLIEEADTPPDPELLPPDGGKLLKLGSLPTVLLLAVGFM